MYRAIVVSSGILVVVIPALLLACRFFWPHRLGWLYIVIITATSSCLLVSMSVHFGYEAHVGTELASCQTLLLSDPRADCPLGSYDVLVPVWYLRWMPGMLCLSILLPLYGLLRRFNLRRQSA